MSDYNSRLPVRTEANGDVVAFLADGTTPSQLLGIDASGRITIKLDDGAGNIITSQANGAQQALDVGINVAGIQIDPRQIRALTAADIVTVQQGTSPWLTQDAADGSASGGTAASKSNLSGGIFNTALPTLTNGQQSSIQLDASGRVIIAPLTVSSVIKVDLQDGAGTALTSSLINSKQRLDVNLPSEGAPAAAAPVDAVQVGGTDGTNLRALKTDTAGQLIVDIKDSTGAAITTLNPLPVVVSSTLPGTSINKYNTTVNLAASASQNHDYSITASKTFIGKKFWASGSGKIRMDVQTSPDGTTFTTFWTGFNSTAMPNVSVDLDLLSITDTGAGAKIRIILTNDDKQPFDVFSTISGTEQ